MRSTKFAVLAGTLVLVIGASALALAQGQKPAAGATAKPHHIVVAPDQVKWGPAPPALPPGAQMAVLAGDPTQKGPFVARAKFPDGYRVPPHWHPTDENIAVLSGTFMIGMGDKLEMSSMTSLGAGGFTKMPADMRHYAGAKGETVIQIHGMGPFEITYVNAADDPRKKSTPTK